jgi:1-deoxy-D-xylulose-5-phosphate synthase
MVLEIISSPQDLKQLSREDLHRVVDEARQALLEKKNKPTWWTQRTKLWYG